MGHESFISINLFLYIRRRHDVLGIIIFCQDNGKKEFFRGKLVSYRTRSN